MLARVRTALIALSLVVVPSMARAQQHEHRPGMQHPADSSRPPAAPRATLPGQDAFGAIAEVVRILRADPSTDWKRVNVEALRQHLIDMNAVTLGASVAASDVPNGVRMTVTGEGRVRDAIRRMLSAHGAMLAAEGLQGSAEEIAGGMRWTVTTPDPARVAQLRALGFIGILTLGDHHVVHHLQLARGESPHAH